MNGRLSRILIALLACIPSVLLDAQGPNCPRLIQNAQSQSDTMSSVAHAHVPPFATEDALLGAMNANTHHRKVATVIYHPGSSDGTFSLQFGTGHVLYSGNDLRKLTQQLNQASGLSPGDTLYVNIDAPDNRLEGLNRSLRMQQKQVDGNIQVVPLGGDALDMETRELLFTHPVKDIQVLAAYESTANPGWIERIVDFTVNIGDAIRTVKVIVSARTREILDDVVFSLQAMFAHPSNLQQRSVTELVSAARYKLKEEKGHSDQVDYLFAAQLGGSFMVSLPVSAPPQG